MKKLLMVMLIMLSSITLYAGQSKHKNPKKYIKGDELFLYPHGIYLAYPGKLYRISALYKSRHGGYYTYKSKMRNFPLSKMDDYDWGSPKRVNK
jgi:hypothetical protein